MTGPPPPDAAKAEWRRWARQERAAVDFTGVSAAICAHLRSSELLRGTVLTFLAMGDEVDLSDLHTMAEVRWAVTRTPDEGPLTVHLLAGPLELHRLGFAQPAADAPRLDITELDVLLIPGLAFDRSGGRLGRGKAYVDGLLARVRDDATAVGIAPEAVIVDRLPMEPHDRHMDRLASEGGIRDFAFRRSE